MKSIPLGIITVPPRAGQPSVELSCTEVLREILFAGGERGLATSDLLTSMEVWGVIKANAAQPAVLLEDAQHRYLMGRLAAFRWANGTEDAARYVLALQSPDTVDPNEDRNPVR